MTIHKPKHQHYCHHCNNTGTCQPCDGRGCMECNYTGMCCHCQDVSYQADDRESRAPHATARQVGARHG